MAPKKVPDTFVYDTSHKNRGIAIVINDSTNRQGSKKDVETVEATLKELKFAVRVFQDYSDLQLMKELRDIASDDHTNNDCLVVVAMAHGEYDKIVVQGYDVYIDQILRNFVGDKCLTLKEKPKLLFIQACRGDKEEVASQIAHDARPVSLAPVNVTMPMYADVLVMYSSYKDYVSYREADKGSWFVQSLCEELQKDVAKKELLSLLTNVSHEVAIKDSIRKQMPCICSTLTKEFYFVPKPDADVESMFDVVV